MNTRVHVLAGIAAAALRSSVVSATGRTGPLPWCVAAFFAALPDVAEWLLRNARRPDATLTPDPLLADGPLADAIVRGVADVAKHARDSGRTVRLRIRPVPAARGLLRLRILPRRVEACVAPGDSAPHSAPLPSSATPWPGVLDVAPPEGVVLSLAPAPNAGRPLDIAALAPGRGRGLPHSPLLLLVLPALLLLVPGCPLLSAAALGLLSHGLIDLLGDQGLPRRDRSAPGLGLHLFRDASPVAASNVAVLSAAVLAVGIVCNTPFVLHRTRLCAVLLGAACAALLLKCISVFGASALHGILPPALCATPLSEGGKTGGNPPSERRDAPGIPLRPPPSERGVAPQGPGGVLRAKPMTAENRGRTFP